MANRFRILFIALLALLLASGAARADGDMGDHDMDGAEMQEMMESIEELEGLEGPEFEIAYVNRIIPHHEGAVEMARTVVDRAPHREVRDAAAKIIEDQEAEIEMLTGFLEGEYGEELDRDERQVMDESMMRHLDEASPEMAEKMFLLMMREHHQTAVEMGEIALDRGRSEEILGQAKEMVESQRAEQDLFAGWLEAWHGIDAPAPTGDMMAAMELAMDMEMPDAGGGALSGPTGGIPLGFAALGLLGALAAYVLRRRLA